MPRIPQLYKQKTTWQQWESLPKRIFLDSNVVKYLSDFGEFIFEGYREKTDSFCGAQGRLIKKTHRLYSEIENLADIFRNIHRASFEFAISQNIDRELSKKQNKILSQWVNDLRCYWQDTIAKYQDPFSKKASDRHRVAVRDSRLKTNISSEDRAIILDALKLNCDALLTVDRFADETNQKYFFEKFGIMILWPSDFIKILGPFQAIYNG